MKNLTPLVAVLLLPVCLQAQYYYKDVLGTRQSNELNRLMKKARLATVSVKNYNFDDSEIESFLCEQYTENNCRYVVTVTGSPIVGEYHLHSWFNNQSQITKSVDSTDDTIISNIYEYDPQGRLRSITVNSFELRSRDKLIQQHLWQYNSRGYPEKMFAVKNGTDTITVLLKTDSAGNVTEEVSYKKGREKERYYYYYDGQNRLTDVVKYNEMAAKLLPEFVFEYNNAGQVTRQMTFVPGSSDYQIWLYSYDANGLKTEERCYLKGNMFRGKLIYSYTFNKDE